MKYYGLYRSSTIGQTGCVKEFMTTPQDAMVFPPQTNYYCDLCKKEHGFRFMGGRMANTPKQVASLNAYCDSHGIETEVIFG